MADLTDLQGVTGERLTAEQIRGILNQIDLDVLNVARDGKLAAAKYGVQGSVGATVDRAANLKALLAARSHYERLLQEAEEHEGSGWVVSVGEVEALGKGVGIRGE